MLPKHSRLACPITPPGYVYDTETELYYLQSRYYNANVGRFINADTFVSTKKAGVGCAIFTYCFNNPVNYVDTAGTDAIWIHETDSASYLGHSGLLVEDEETGKWYFFYWGPVNENENPLILATSGSPCNCVVIEVEIGDEDLYSIEGLNKILGNSTDEFVKSRSGLITDIHYFEGDFSQTLSYLKTLANEENLEYHLLRDNCVQNTWEALGNSDIRFASTSCPVIPDYAYAKMLILDFQFTKCAHFLSLEDFSAVCL